MADRLYLSLWYPNFRLEALPAALTGVLRQFALVGGKRVTAATAYPINFTQPPAYQRIYVDTGQGTAIDRPEANPVSSETDAALEAAVAEATGQLHDDMAYEFEMRWHLWAPVQPDPAYSRLNLSPAIDDDTAEPESEFGGSALDNPDNPDALWKPRLHTVRILGFGPAFDVAGYEQNGHLLVDFGLDTPWVPEADEDDEPGGNEGPLDEQAQAHIQQNIEKLLAFTLLVEKNCGISSRLLWTESGEPLAEKLIARLQRVH
jgi:hypothetical protein